MHVLNSYVTTNDLVDSEIASFNQLQGLTLIVIHNNGLSNGLNFVILASHDYINWVPLKTSTLLAADTITYETSGEPWEHYKIQTQSAVGGNHTTVHAWIKEDKRGGKKFGTLDKLQTVINRNMAIDDGGIYQALRVDSEENLHVSHEHNIQTITITNPGLAYANSTNALCIAVTPTEAEEIEIISIYISTKAVGDFYLVAKDLDIAAGGTTSNNFDLIGIFGDGIADTSEVVWAYFNHANGRSQSQGGYHNDMGDGKELYLIAPDTVYSITVNYLID